MHYFIGDSSRLCHYWKFRFPLVLLAILLAIVLGLICRVKSRILLARVNQTAGAKLSAWMLPNLAPAVPMKTKLRQYRGHGARLFVLKLNPNPFADNLAQLPRTRGLVVEQVNDLRCGKSPVLETESEINPM
jgi:hypothetical protein